MTSSSLFVSFTNAAGSLMIIVSVCCDCGRSRVVVIVPVKVPTMGVDGCLMELNQTVGRALRPAPPNSSTLL